MSEITTISVAGTPGYDITVGNGVISRLGEALPAGAKKVLIVHTATVGAEAEKLRAQLSADREVLLAEIPDAEQGKRIEVAAFCWQILGQSDFTRSDAIVGFGGGATTDVAGFVAATWLRGIAVDHADVFVKIIATLLERASGAW